MTDEPREENQPENEDVEAHSVPLMPLEPNRSDDDDDVEAHSVPIFAPTQP